MWNDGKDKLTSLSIRGTEVYLLHNKITDFAPAFEEIHWASVVIDGIGTVAETQKEALRWSQERLLRFFIDTIEDVVLKVLLEPKKLTIERRQYYACTKYLHFDRLETFHCDVGVGADGVG